MRGLDKEIVGGLEAFLELARELSSTRMLKIYPEAILKKMEHDRLGPIKTAVNEISSKIFAAANQYKNIGNGFLDKIPDLWLKESELENYVYLNLLLVECLRLAAIADRQQILNTHVLQ